MQVLSYNQAAARANLCRRSFERLIAPGTGPAIIEVSPRRRGILESDFETWLLSRRRAAPGESAKVPSLDRRGVRGSVAEAMRRQRYFAAAGEDWPAFCGARRRR